jgi:uncharacterized XkdX family phage protein
MSKNYEKVKSYYILGLWDDIKLQNAVTKGWITQAEYEEIKALKEENQNE